MKERPLWHRLSQYRPSAVRAYLLFIAVSCTLPVAVLGGYFAYHFVSGAAEHRQADMQDRLRLMRNALDQRIERIVGELEVLGHSPDLEAGDLARFKSQADFTAKLIGAITVLLCDRDGNQFLNTRPLPPNAPIPRRQNLEALRKAWDTGVPQVSDLYPATVDRQPVISIEVPLSIGGQTRYVLAAGIVSSTFSDLMQQYVPEGAIGSIVDRNGTLVARKPLLPSRIGAKTIPEVLVHVGEPAAFWIKAISRSGEPTYTSLLRSYLTGWTVNLALPREAVDAPLHRTLLLFGALGAAALLAGLLLAHLISARFVRALSVLQEHVRALAGRQPVTPAIGPIAEINAMDETLYQVGNDLSDAMHRQELLLGEINHRVKNTLATINAIARLTRNSSASVPEFVDGFQERVFALARAYDLLTRSDWSGADLGSLVETTVSPYVRSSRINISGPAVALRPKFALAMAAALQELTTNAAKYGSLSKAGGALDIRWAAEDDTVRLEWVESGGPAVTSPSRRGFGTKLINELLAKDTGWTVEARYESAGFECRITMRGGLAGDATEAAQ